jgi:hypothetical protein
VAAAPFRTVRLDTVMADIAVTQTKDVNSPRSGESF